MLVIDASAALYAASSPNGFSPILPLSPIAPPIMWSEALSALRETLWRKTITPTLATSTRRSLLAAPIGREMPAEMYEEAWRISEELGWAKTYDAEYVALARIFDCRLLTADARLRRGAGKLVPIIGPNEL